MDFSCLYFLLLKIKKEINTIYLFKKIKYKVKSENKTNQYINIMHFSCNFPLILIYSC